jgi:hypothetical protein
LFGDSYMTESTKGVIRGVKKLMEGMLEKSRE